MKSKIRNFQLQTRLGQGSYGVIFKAINKIDKSVCVLKQIRMNKMSQKTKKSTLNQATIMGKLVHPFIVQYQQSFIQDNTLHIVMQYCDNGDLSMFLKLQNKKPLKQQKIWKFFIQICMGLEFIHKNKILHRDIKTLNIFLNKNQDIKIGDLGVAKMLQANDFAQTMVGTPFYLSPQLCEQKPYNQKSDIWALGCLLYQLCTYKHPFQAANQASLILKIVRGKYSPIPEFYTKQLKDMIDLCLERDYKRRPTSTMILARPKVKDMIAQFKINEKVQDQFKKMKSNKQNKQPQTIQVNKSKQKVPQKIVQKVNVVNVVNNSNQKVASKDVNIVNVNVRPQSQVPQPLNQIKIVQDKSKFVPQQNNKIPVQQKKVIFPQKKQVISSPSPPLSNQKKQSKKEFLMNLEKRVGQRPAQCNQERIAKIDAKIKQIQKIQKSKPVSIFSNNQISSSKQKQVNNQNKPVVIQNKAIPPLPTKSKQIVTKVRMEKPPVQPKVYESSKNLKGKGIIKSGGFSRQIKDQVNISSERISNERPSQYRKKNQSDLKKPVLFGLDQEQKVRQSIQNNKPTPKHHTHQQQLAKHQYSSERHIKVAQISSSRIQKSKDGKQSVEPERYIFKKQKDNQRASNSSNYIPPTRVRKGSKVEMSRLAKNLSKYSTTDITKQQQAEVMNLPDKIHNHQQASSDQEQRQDKIVLNKRFSLKQVNDDLILQKYQQILSGSNKQIQAEQQHQSEEKQNSIGTNENKYQKKNTNANNNLYASRKVKVNKNLNQYDEDFINYQKYPNTIKNQVQKEQEMQNSLLYQDEQKRQDEKQEQIQDQSQECIEYAQQNGDQYEIQEIYEINKFNLRQYENHQSKCSQDMVDQSVNDMENSNQKYAENEQNESFWNQKIQQPQKDSVWSFDQEPQLPLLQEREVPDFQEANPYLVEQQEETIEMKKNYLQIKLQQNMKREDQINKLMQIKIEECRAMVPKYFDQILIFFRKKINMDGDYTQSDQKQIDDFLLKKGLTDQRKFQNVYKIMHFQMQLQNTRKIIQRLCKKLNDLEQQEH